MTNSSSTPLNQRLSDLVRSNLFFFLVCGALLLPSFLTSIQQHLYLYIGSQIAAWVAQSILIVKLVHEATGHPVGFRQWLTQGVIRAPKVAWVSLKIFGLLLAGWIIFSILGLTLGHYLALGHFHGVPVTLAFALLVPSLLIGTRCAFALPFAVDGTSPYSRTPIRASFRLTRPYWGRLCLSALSLFALTWPMFLAFSPGRTRTGVISILAIALWCLAYWIFMSVIVVLAFDAVAETPVEIPTPSRSSAVARTLGGLGLIGAVALIAWAWMSRDRIARGFALTRTVANAVGETAALRKKGLLQVRAGEIVENYPGNLVKNRYSTSGETKGSRVDYYETGQKKSETIMDHGQRVAFRAWFQNGQLEGETLFTNGQPTVMKYWYANGKARSVDEFATTGERKTTMFYEDGHKQSVMIMKDGRPIREMTNWYPNGQISYVSTISQDGSRSHLVLFYQDGKKRGEENYLRNKKDGEQIYWDQSGKAMKIFYKDGVKLQG